MTEEHDAALLQRVQQLADDAASFATDAFNAGHYPNPVGHAVAGCVICAAAKWCGDYDTLEIPDE